MMRVGLLHFSLHIPHAQSLKQRRRELRSIKDLMRRRLNVAVAEVGHHDVWQVAELAVTTVSDDETLVRNTLARALSVAESNANVEVTDPEVEVW